MRINKIITLLLGIVFSQSQTALAEESWTPVNEIPSMEKQGANVTQNNQYLYLFGPGQCTRRISRNKNFRFAEQL